ncbi:MAG: protein-disulfide reductase DsbD family protein [Burkholderiaceae bacterium]|nr:protein-disulfide reductase DsbD family protein [Burkholderiaceae bacterium]
MLKLLTFWARRPAIWFWGLFLLATTVPAFASSLLGQSQTRVHNEQVTAELLVHAPDGFAPGAKVWAGLQLTHAPDWHTYWKNSGDSGLPTQLNWQLPPGTTAGEIAWPTPKKFPLGPLANYGYDGTVLLAVPLTVESTATGPTITLVLEASWLVCRKECIPQDGRFSLTLPVDKPTAIHGMAFEAAQQRLPTSVANNSIYTSVEGQFLHINWPSAPTQWQGQHLEFFPEQVGLVDAGTPWEQSWDGSHWTARIPLSPQRLESPATLSVVLAVGRVPHGQGASAGVAFESTVAGQWPTPTGNAGTGVSPALQAALDRNAQSATAAAASAPSGSPSMGAFWLAVAGALVGGMVLNLMPCVFPVLAIKVLAFAQHAEDRRTHRVAGLAYTAGVVMSFLALGALLLALRSAGEQLGWGFQLQSPAVVASLAVLFTGIGLNLAGGVEFGKVAPASLGNLRAKNPALDAWLTGVLATAVASPCTAPFMGASLGLAIALPTAQALAVFGAVGLSMALPYLAASWVPAVARALPRPGAWMVTFRQLLAFPMWATVVWLLWVLGQQSGIDGAASLLMWLVALALLLWTLGLTGRSRALGSVLAVAVLAWLSWVAGPNITRLVESEPATASTVPNASAVWQAWSPTRQAQLLAQGHPVLVDFTAAWCVTCQYNKRTTLADERVLASVAERGVALLRADWTRRDPAVTAALAELGRNGVPVYAIYRTGQPTTVLSEVLSVREVLDALAPLPIASVQVR